MEAPVKQENGEDVNVVKKFKSSNKTTHCPGAKFKIEIKVNSRLIDSQ